MGGSFLNSLCFNAHRGRTEDEKLELVMIIDSSSLKPLSLDESSLDFSADVEEICLVLDKVTSPLLSESKLESTEMKEDLFTDPFKFSSFLFYFQRLGASRVLLFQMNHSGCWMKFLTA